MSFTNNDRKIRSKRGKTFPTSQKSGSSRGTYDFPSAIAAALHRAYGGSGAAIKTVVALTGANERAVRNWFDGKNGPNGEHLIELARHCDQVLEAFLQMAGRDDALTVRNLTDIRDKLAEMLATIDELQNRDRGS